MGQYSKLESIGLGHLDKSGVAELTFQGRGPAKAKKTSRKKSIKKASKALGAILVRQLRRRARMAQGQGMRM